MISYELNRRIRNDHEPSIYVDFAKISMMHESLLQKSEEYGKLFSSLVKILNSILKTYRSLRKADTDVKQKKLQKMLDSKVDVLKLNLSQWNVFFCRIPGSIENKVDCATLLLCLHAELIKYLSVKILNEGIFSLRGDGKKGKITDFTFKPTEVNEKKLKEIQAILAAQSESQFDIYQIFREVWAQPLIVAIATAVTFNSEAAERAKQEIREPFQGHSRESVA